MSAPLTHATVRGLALLQGLSPHAALLMPSFNAACGAETVFFCFALKQAIPTCPACAALRDAALEGRES